MFLLAAFARCLLVVRKLEEQHPVDGRAASAAIAKVEVKELVVRYCLCGPRKRLPVPHNWKYCTAELGNRNGNVVFYFHICTTVDLHISIICGKLQILLRELPT